MKSQLKSIYERQHFMPGALGVFLNPFFLARRELAAAVGDLSRGLKGRLLDVGCGTKPYRSLMHVDSYVGIEVARDREDNMNTADVLYDGIAFPFDDETFDSILCNQVLEHVFTPDLFLREVGRVMKPGGKLLLTAPFVWDEHEQPFDYARYSSFGLISLLENNGFRVQEHRKLLADASILFQLFNAYLFKVTQRWPRSMKVTLTVTLMALVNILGCLSQRMLPSNPDLFLDHVVLAEKNT